MKRNILSLIASIICAVQVIILVIITVSSFLLKNDVEFEKAFIDSLALQGFALSDYGYSFNEIMDAANMVLMFAIVLYVLKFSFSIFTYLKSNSTLVLTSAIISAILVLFIILFTGIFMLASFDFLILIIYLIVYFYDKRKKNEIIIEKDKLVIDIEM
ncbi:flagellar biosynthesis protein FlhB [Bacilli bacterium PM5-3]|nr:flagellar biosynthesis protein FlhB [Bacilli bacterium PM5-3]MDH6604216.1 flagellar biosynthesis protein FlhB [Bacilli bacterium PM5-9]